MTRPNSKTDKIVTIKNGRGIQNILNEAYKIFGNPLVIFNTEYALLAYTNDIGDDPIINEIIAYGTFSYETQKFFMEEGFGDTVANIKDVTLLVSEKLKHDRMLGKLFNKSNIHVANLVMVACNKPFEEGDEAAFEALCKLLSKEIIKSELYQTYGMIYQETYIRKLIDDEIKEKGIYTAHIAIIYSNLKTNLYLAVADIGKCDPDRTKLCYFRDLFKKAQPAFKYSIYNKNIIIIINIDKTLDVKKDLGKLTGIFKRNDIYVGISSCFENLFELRKYYLEAVNALNQGLESDGKQPISLYASDAETNA